MSREGRGGALKQQKHGLGKRKPTNSHKSSTDSPNRQPTKESKGGKKLGDPNPPRPSAVNFSDIFAALTQNTPAGGRPAAKMSGAKTTKVKASKTSTSAPLQQKGSKGLSTPSVAWNGAGMKKVQTYANPVKASVEKSKHVKHARNPGKALSKEQPFRGVKTEQHILTGLNRTQTHRGIARSSTEPKKKRESRLKRILLRERSFLYGLQHPESQPVPLQHNPACIGYAFPVLMSQVASISRLEHSEVLIPEEGSLGEEGNGVIGKDEVASELDDDKADTVVGKVEITSELDSDKVDAVVDKGEIASDFDNKESSEQEHSSVLIDNSGDPQNEALSGSPFSSGHSKVKNKTIKTEESGEIGSSLTWDPRICSPIFFTEKFPENKLGQEAGSGMFVVNPPQDKEVRYEETASRGAGKRTRNKPDVLYPVRSYVRQAISAELDQVVRDMLSKLMVFQNRIRMRDPTKAKSKRRLVFGMREVARGVKMHKFKCVIVARNIEQGFLQDGVDDRVKEILDTASEEGEMFLATPVVFALSRRKIGEALNVKANASVVGIYSADGAHDELKKTLNMADQLRSIWSTKVGEEFLHEKWAHCSVCHKLIEFIRVDCIACGITRCEKCSNSARSKKVPCTDATKVALFENQEGNQMCQELRIPRILPRHLIETANKEMKTKNETAKNCGTEKETSVDGGVEGDIATWARQSGGPTNCKNLEHQVENSSSAHLDKGALSVVEEMKSKMEHHEAQSIRRDSIDGPTTNSSKVSLRAEAPVFIPPSYN